MTAKAVPFDETPPAVDWGDPVEIRTADGTWQPAVARSEPRYDFDNAVGRRCWLTVAVVLPGSRDIVNWPAEDVRRTP